MTATDQLMYLIDSDTGAVICGPIADSTTGYDVRYPHRRLTAGPYPAPGPDGDPFANRVDEYAWQRALAERHGLPRVAASSSVTLRERPADDVLRATESCSGGFLCNSTRLVLVTWHGRDDDHRAIGGRPRVWWRRVLCGEHLREPLDRLIDRSLHDPSPDSPRDVGVLIAVGAEWGIRWAHGRVDPQPSQAEACRFAVLAAPNGATLVTRPGPGDEWTEAPAVDRVTTTDQHGTGHGDSERLALHAAPTMAAALDDLLAITRCATPDCDDDVAEFADRCAACLSGHHDVEVEVEP